MSSAGGSSRKSAVTFTFMCRHAMRSSTGACNIFAPPAIASYTAGNICAATRRSDRVRLDATVASTPGPAPADAAPLQLHNIYAIALTSDSIASLQSSGSMTPMSRVIAVAALATTVTAGSRSTLQQAYVKEGSNVPGESESDSWQLLQPPHACLRLGIARPPRTFSSTGLMLPLVIPLRDAFCRWSAISAAQSSVALITTAQSAPDCHGHHMMRCCETCPALLQLPPP